MLLVLRPRTESRLLRRRVSKKVKPYDGQNGLLICMPNLSNFVFHAPDLRRNNRLLWLAQETSLRTCSPSWTWVSTDFFALYVTMHNTNTDRPRHVLIQSIHAPDFPYESASLMLYPKYKYEPSSGEWSLTYTTKKIGKKVYTLFPAFSLHDFSAYACTKWKI